MLERRKTGNRKTGRALCLPEMHGGALGGKRRFGLAKRGWKNSWNYVASREMDYFMALFVPGFYISLDGISGIHKTLNGFAGWRQILSGTDVA
ncbi:hypothetical protein KCP69_11205 [Salmonella enterica subsp. enterica]|nr:hypothetical protein KCP69_11205 [Salmonella enterica subsp. enterica]